MEAHKGGFANKEHQGAQDGPGMISFRLEPVE